MASNCHLFLPSCSIVAMMQTGDNVVCQCVSLAVTSLIAHIKPFKAHAWDD